MFFTGSSLSTNAKVPAHVYNCFEIRDHRSEACRWY